MGCNCGGSTPRSTEKNPRVLSREQRQAASPPARRAGGPGEPGYYWNGPQKAAPKTPAE